MDQAEMVTVISRDESFPVNKLALRAYRTLLGARDGFAGQAGEIDLRHLPGNVVRQIISWAERHMNDPDRPVYSSSSENVVVTLTSDDENHLANLEVELLFAVISAADQLLLLDLLDGACQVAAKVLEQMDPVEIRQLFFDGESGFTEEEEDELRKENEWIEEL